VSIVALTDLATVKELLNITASGNDTELGHLIDRVSLAGARYCNRVFGSASYTETYDGSGTNKQWLNNRPVSAVTSVTIDGTLATQRPSGQPLAFGWTFDKNQIQLTGWCFPMGQQNVQVSYTAGYAVSEVLTPDLWSAAAEWVAYIYKQMGRIGKASEGLAQNNTAFIKDNMPETVKAVFDNYKQMALVQNYV
jgi:hypothetical protein